MSGTFSIFVGERGRVVIPAEVRAKHHWNQGTELVALETPHGVQLMSKSEVLAALKGALAGAGSVAEFLAERRRAARAE